jgi:hypothetical protein
MHNRIPNMEDQDILKAELDNIIELIDSRSLEIQKFEVYNSLFKTISHKTRKSGSKPKTCIYPNCTSLSIKRSHSIAKSNSLKLIADKGKVLQPVLDEFGSNLKLSMESIGINKASTFPGYCEIHEKLFQQYENRNLNEESFVPLQVYRAICREIVHLSIEVNIIKTIIDTYKSTLRQEAFNILITNLKNRGISKEFGAFNVKKNDEILIQFQCLKNDFESRISHLKNYSERILHEYIGDSPSRKKTTINLGVCIDYKFPVALCGYTSLAYGNSTIKQMLFITNIIPMQNCTYIFCSAYKEHSKFFRNIIDFYFQSPLTILSFIESFMIHSSDHWFINPPYWNSFSKIKQEMILTEILNVDKLITDEFEYSIFDDIRESILSEYMKHTEQFSGADRIMVKKEKKKLTNICRYNSPTEIQLIERIEKYWNGKLRNHK